MRSAWMPSGQGSGRRSWHEETTAVEDNDCHGTAPDARDEAVAASTEVNAVAADKFNVWG